MKITQLVLSLLLAFFFSTCTTTKKQPSTKHIFYLHGRIIELQGPNAISERFGKYEYYAILDSLQTTGATIHHEIRTADVDFEDFCRQTSQAINQLVERGIPPAAITIIGASKGAVMAMRIADQNKHTINYVLLGANNTHIEQENDWNLHGKILGIYEKTDSLAGRAFNTWMERSTNATSFKQLEINTGLGHGFLYRPLAAWWLPTKEWIETSY